MDDPISGESDDLQDPGKRRTGRRKHRRRASAADTGFLSRRRVVAISATSLSVLAIAGAAGLYSVYDRLNHNITTVDALTKPPSADSKNGPLNILLIGSDSRDGANAKYGDAGSGARSDTAMLLHVAAGRKYATVASIPRDTMVQIPACVQPNGATAQPYFGMFNSAFTTGGAACTVKTVEALSGLTIDHVLVLDFTGFKKIVDAIGGIPVTLPYAVNDPDSHLNLPAGTSIVTGEQALAFVRARHNIGNGSDIGRMVRQQQFLDSALETLESNGTLDDPTKLYKVLDAATKALTTDPSLGSLSALADFASDLKQIPRQNITYLTVPWHWYQPDPNRVQLAPKAQELFDAMRTDSAIPADVLALSAGQGDSQGEQKPS